MVKLLAVFWPVLLVFGGVVVDRSFADKKDAKKTCPISGKPVDGAVFLVVNGEKVLSCCEHCTSTYARRNRSSSAKCLVSGQPVKMGVYLTIDGEKVYFCCETCRDNYVEKNVKTTKKERD